MSTLEKPASAPQPERGLLDGDGFPWLENGERMDQKTFHERYLRTPEGFKAELIGGIVYVMSSPVTNRHGRGAARLIGWPFVYVAATPGTEGQARSTTILGD